MKSIILITAVFLYGTAFAQEGNYQVFERKSDLKGLELLSVHSNETDLSFNVYYEPSHKDITQESLSDLYTVYNEVAELGNVPVSNVDWKDVAIVSYEDPYINKGFNFWTIEAPGPEVTTEEFITRIYSFVGHEQTHSLQDVISCPTSTPRWFHEGQAGWIQYHIVKTRLLHEVLDLLTIPEGKENTSPNLNSWGGMKIKKEAFMSKLSEEDRKKMEEDSTYVPQGPFRFGPSDFTSDESNTPLRYYASLQLFLEIEDNIGREAMQSWFTDIYENNICDTEELTSSLKEGYGLDITAELKK